MDIAALSMSLAANKTLSDVGTAMLNKTMDLQKTEGAGVIQMMNAASAAQMENSVNPHIGGNFDMSI